MWGGLSSVTSGRGSSAPSSLLRISLGAPWLPHHPSSNSLGYILGNKGGGLGAQIGVCLFVSFFGFDFSCLHAMVCITMNYLRPIFMWDSGLPSSSGVSGGKHWARPPPQQCLPAPSTGVPAASSLTWAVTPLSSSYLGGLCQPPLVPHCTTFLGSRLHDV